LKPSTLIPGTGYTTNTILIHTSMPIQYQMDGPVGPDLSHPDSLIRITSTVLKFRCPKITAKAKKIDFARSFRTVGTHPTTQSVLKTANSSRDYLYKSLNTGKKNVPHKTIAVAAEKYITPIHQLLIACRVQPESARLDERLIFEWSTGIEEKERSFKSEAIMYELVMTIATEAMAAAGTGTDECAAGEFKGACRNFKKAAGIFDYLAKTQLPQWLSKGGKIDDDALPAEAKIPVCEAMKVLMLGISQQMAVATVLMKEGTPNWSLLAKLSLGISEQFKEFVTIMRSKASSTKDRIDLEFFTLMTFQIEMQRSLSLYFHSRHYFEKELKYGLAIAMLHKAVSMTKTRETPTGRGLPEIRSKSPLKSLEKDLNDVKKHMNTLLASWEKDNSGVYFEKVPLKLPAEMTLSEGTQMMKPEPYELKVVDPVALILPDAGSGGEPIDMVDSDAELARQLQEQLNAED